MTKRQIKEILIAAALFVYYSLVLTVATITFALRLVFSALWSLLTKIIK